MPGRFFLTTPPAAIAALHDASVADLADEPPRLNIQPGQPIVVLDDTLTLDHMRWGMIPVGRVNARGRPVMETIVNARGETVFDKSAFSGVARCVVPADGWYEWTGKPRQKQAWRIFRSGGALLHFAAICDIWTGPGGVSLRQVATVTCAPSEDVAAVHDRMGVILDPGDVPLWLTGPEDEARALVQPLPEGVLTVEPADDVDWTAA